MEIAAGTDTLILLLSGIGNAVLLIPMLRALRAYETGSNIELIITQKVVQSLLVPENLVDKFIFYSNDHSKGVLRYRLSQIRLLKNLLGKRYDRFLVCENMSNATPLLVAMVPATIKVGYTRNRWPDRLLDFAVSFDTGIHEVERRLNLLRVLGWNIPYESPRLRLTEKEIINGQNRIADVSDGKTVVGLHPGCSEFLRYKRWPAERFAEVIKSLHFDCGLQTVLFGGPGEEKIAEAVRLYANGLFVPSFTGKLNIRQTAATIAACDHFISNDSGLMHIAAAVGTPQIALFGNTDVTKNTPQSESAIVIDGKLIDGGNENPINNITVTNVLETFEELRNVSCNLSLRLR